LTSHPTKILVGVCPRLPGGVDASGLHIFFKSAQTQTNYGLYSGLSATAAADSVEKKEVLAGPGRAHLFHGRRSFVVVEHVYAAIRPRCDAQNKSVSCHYASQFCDISAVKHPGVAPISCNDSSFASASHRLAARFRSTLTPAFSLPIQPSKRSIT